MKASYSCERGGRITQLQYLLQLFLANFVELRVCELRRTQKAKFAEFLFHALW
jgi:hypothetical protein